MIYFRQLKASIGLAKKSNTSKGLVKEYKMEKINSFFGFNKDEGKIVLNPPFMGSDCWSLRSGDNVLLFSIDQFLDCGSVLLEDGEHILNLCELDDYACFSIKFVVKGRQVIIENITCRNAYKRSYFSVMPDRGIYFIGS